MMNAEITEAALEGVMGGVTQRLPQPGGAMIVLLLVRGAVHLRVFPEPGILEAEERPGEGEATPTPPGSSPISPPS